MKQIIFDINPLLEEFRIRMQVPQSYDHGIYLNGKRTLLIDTSSEQLVSNNVDVFNKDGLIEPGTIIWSENNIPIMEDHGNGQYSKEPFYEIGLYNIFVDIFNKHQYDSNSEKKAIVENKEMGHVLPLLANVEMEVETIMVAHCPEFLIGATIKAYTATTGMREPEYIVKDLDGAKKALLYVGPTGYVLSDASIAIIEHIYSEMVRFIERMFMMNYIGHDEDGILSLEDHATHQLVTIGKTPYQIRYQELMEECCFKCQLSDDKEIKENPTVADLEELS